MIRQILRVRCKLLYQSQDIYEVISQQVMLILLCKTFKKSEYSWRELLLLQQEGTVDFVMDEYVV